MIFIKEASFSQGCHVLLYFRPLIMLYEHYTNDPLVCEEKRVKQLMENYRDILRRRSRSNVKYLNAYLELCENLLRIHANGEVNMGKLVDEVMGMLENMSMNGFDFELYPEASNKCLDIIK